MLENYFLLLINSVPNAIAASVAGSGITAVTVVLPATL
jgi:hypothetical protein